MQSAANRESGFMSILKGFDGKRLVLPDRIELPSARTLAYEINHLFERRF
jgi:hypothetical protein